MIRRQNPYFQFFCGEEFFQHRLPFDRSSLTRWRQRMGEAKLTALIQESLSVATRTEAMKPKDLARVVVASGLGYLVQAVTELDRHAGQPSGAHRRGRLSSPAS